MTRSESGSWAILAATRVVLACIVGSCHINWFVPLGHPVGRLEGFGGFAAVLGFLVISGYSIAHSLSRKREGFYRRRALRIYPVMILSVALSCAPFFLLGPQVRTFGHVFHQPSLGQVISSLFFLDGIVTRSLPSNAVIWTLALEVWCYVFAPLLLKLTDRVIAILIAISATAYLAQRIFQLPFYADLRFGLPLLLLAWAWLSGFLFYRHRQTLGAGAILVTLAIVLCTLNRNDGGRFSQLTIALSLCIVATVGKWSLPAWSNPFANWLGDLSYPLYLMHQPALMIGFAVLKVRNSWLLLAIVFVTSAAALLVESVIKRIVARRSPISTPTSPVAAEVLGSPMR